MRLSSFTSAGAAAAEPRRQWPLAPLGGAYLRVGAVLGRTALAAAPFITGLALVGLAVTSCILVITTHWS